MDNIPAFVSFLLLFALIAATIVGFWRQDLRSGLWQKEYVNPPKDTPLHPFSEIKELGKMAGVGIVLFVIVIALQRVFHIW